VRTGVIFDFAGQGYQPWPQILAAVVFLALGVWWLIARDGPAKISGVLLIAASAWAGTEAYNLNQTARGHMQDISSGHFDVVRGLFSVGQNSDGHVSSILIGELTLAPPRAPSFAFWPTADTASAIDGACVEAKLDAREQILYLATLRAEECLSAPDPTG